MIDIKKFYSLMMKNRGKVDRGSLIGITSFGLLLKKVELDSPVCYNEKFSLPFLKLLYGEAVTADDLVDYASGIEKEYNLPPTSLSEVLRQMLARVVDDSCIRDIIEALSSIAINSISDLTETFRSVLFALVKDDRSIGQYYCGNAYVSKLENEIMNINPGESVFDGYCGYGETLSRIAKKDVSFYLQDIDRYAVLVATINMIINGANRIHVSCGDTNAGVNDKFDCIISEPPLASHYEADYVKEMTGDLEFSSSRTLFVERTVSLLNDNGRAVILVPASTLFETGMTQKLRRKLYELGWIEAVVGLPQGVLAPYAPGVITALLVVNKTKKEKPFVMIDSTDLWKKIPGVPNKVIEDASIKKMHQLICGKIEEDGLSKIVSFSDDSDFNFTPSYYVNPYEVNSVSVLDVNELLKKDEQLFGELEKVCSQLDEIRNHRMLK